MSVPRSHALGRKLVMLVSVMKDIHRHFFQMATLDQDVFGPHLLKPFAALFMSDTLLIVLPVRISLPECWESGGMPRETILLITAFRPSGSSSTRPPF